MKLAIVGSEEKYWSRELAVKAISAIDALLGPQDTLISGGCLRGGVDIWAERIADKKGLKKIIFLPQKNNWYYYKKRNIQIAHECDFLVCVEPGDRKSGGYWTLCYARSIGKLANHVRII